MSHALAAPVHPVLACAETVQTALAEVAEVDPLFMPTTAKQAALLRLSAAAAQLEELRLRLLAAAEDVAEAHGARDAGAWLAHATRDDDATGRRDLALARSLSHRPHLAAAMRAGDLHRAQATAIARALDELPTALGADVLDQAEQALTTQADHLRPRELKIVGRKVLEVIAPDIADDHERRALEAEQTHASSVTSLHTRRRGDGTTDIRIRCHDPVADRLLTYLQALTSPRHPTDRPDDRPGETGHPENPEDRRPYPQRLGHAFAQLLELWDPTRLPLHGGDATTVTVTIDLDTLLDRLHTATAAGIAHLGDHPITAAEARRLACQAHLVPAVLDGRSRVLDLGRSQRLYTRAQRKAMALRDRTCRAAGCTIPAPWCEAHHLTPWSHGGATDLDHGLLLCPFHHHRAHDHRYDHTRHPDGTITFHRRT